MISDTAASESLGTGRGLMGGYGLRNRNSASQSYSATRLGPAGRTRELTSLYRMKRQNLPAQVHDTLQRLEASRQQIEEDLGRRQLTDGNVLVIGPGQHFSEMKFWEQRGNLVVGVDLDPHPGHPTVSHYVRTLLNDGTIRALKTFGRRVTGLDAAYARELSSQLGNDTGGRSGLLSMDAGRLGLRTASFDLAYSRSVFEHLREPGRALSEIGRVLRPGGVAHVELHLYTCDSGAHDARILAGNRGDLPYWAHLRPRHAHRVKPNSYLNEIRLGEWRRLFSTHWPDVRIQLRPSQDQRLQRALPEIRAAGELAGYTDEELLTVGVIARWRRPGDGRDGGPAPEGKSRP